MFKKFFTAAWRSRGVFFGVPFFLLDLVGLLQSMQLINAGVPVWVYTLALVLGVIGVCIGAFWDVQRRLDRALSELNGLRKQRAIIELMAIDASTHGHLTSQRVKALPCFSDVVVKLRCVNRGQLPGILTAVKVSMPEQGLAGSAHLTALNDEKSDPVWTGSLQVGTEESRTLSAKIRVDFAEPTVASLRQSLNRTQSLRLVMDYSYEELRSGRKEEARLDDIAVPLNRLRDEANAAMTAY